MTNRARSTTAMTALGRPSDAGFTLLEVIVAMLILTIGLIAVAGAITYSITASNMSKNVTSAKLIAAAMLEQMQTLRNTGQLAFGQIANEGAVDNTGAVANFAGFSTDFEAVTTTPGPDGIYGTCDDLSTAKGADGLWCTSDDVKDDTLARPDYLARIIITNLNNDSNIKKIEVTIQYPGANGAMLELVGISYLNNNSGTNYIN